MTTITLDDELVKQAIASTHLANAEKAVAKILADYLQQKQQNIKITDLLAMPEASDIDFEPLNLKSTLYKSADFS